MASAPEVGHRRDIGAAALVPAHERESACPPARGEGRSPRTKPQRGRQSGASGRLRRSRRIPGLAVAIAPLVST